MHLIDICAQTWAPSRRDFQKISILPSFLDFFSCVGCPSTFTQATAKILSRQFGQYRFFEGNSESVYGVLRKSIDCQASGLPASCTSFLSIKKKPTTVQSKNPSTIRKRKIPAGKRDRRTGEGGKRWTSFTVFSIDKCMNKAAARSGCPATQTLIIQSAYYNVIAICLARVRMIQFGATIPPKTHLYTQARTPDLASWPLLTFCTMTCKKKGGILCNNRT